MPSPGAYFLADPRGPLQALCCRWRRVRLYEYRPCSFSYPSVGVIGARSLTVTRRSFLSNDCSFVVRVPRVNQDENADAAVAGTSESLQSPHGHEQSPLASQKVHIPSNSQNPNGIDSSQHGQRIGPFIHVRRSPVVRRPIAKRFCEIDRVERDDPHHQRE